VHNLGFFPSLELLNYFHAAITNIRESTCKS
jgi:hypothetical protein